MPTAVAEARSSLVALSRAMEGLSRRQRAVLIALRVEERSRGEVAQWLGVSLRSVHSAHGVTSPERAFVLAAQQHADTLGMSDW
jgi:hypothetical protein